MKLPICWQPGCNFAPCADRKRTPREDSNHPLVTEQTRVAFADPFLRVECNTVRNLITLDQRVALRIAPVDDSRHVVVVVPVLDDGRYYLLGRYRYAIARWSIEFPRFWGRTSDAGWHETVANSLLQEAGLQAQRMRLLGAIHVDPEVVSISTIVILAEQCGGHRPPPDDAAGLIAGSVALTSDDLDQWMRRGEIVCGATLSALCLYRARLRG